LEGFSIVPKFHHGSVFHTAQHQTLLFERDLKFLGDIEKPSSYCSPLRGVGWGEGGWLISHVRPEVKYAQPKNLFKKALD